MRYGATPGGSAPDNNSVSLCLTPPWCDSSWFSSYDLTFPTLLFLMTGVLWLLSTLVSCVCLAHTGRAHRGTLNTVFSSLSFSLPTFFFFWPSLSNTAVHITYPWFQSRWYETKHRGRIRKSMGIVDKIRKKTGCHWKGAQFEASSYCI